MRVAIQIDQAVWERQTFEIEVPDDFDPDNEEHRELVDLKISEVMDVVGTPAEAAFSYSQEVVSEVFSIGTETTLTMPDGTEIDL